MKHTYLRDNSTDEVRRLSDWIERLKGSDPQKMAHFDQLVAVEPFKGNFSSWCEVDKQITFVSDGDIVEGVSSLCSAIEVSNGHSIMIKDKDIFEEGESNSGSHLTIWMG